jgi:hypothetical protein
MTILTTSQNRRHESPSRPQALNWRDHLKVHPAADLFPLLSETDPAALKELARTGLIPHHENGRLTDVQRIAHERMREAGAHVAVAHGIDEAVCQLEQWKLLLAEAAR